MSAAVLVSERAVCAALGGGDPAAVGNCPIWMLGATEAGGTKVHCGDSQPVYAGTMDDDRTLKRT